MSILYILYVFISFKYYLLGGVLLMIDLNCYNRFYYFTDSSMYSLSLAKTLLYINSLSISNAYQALVFVSADRHNLKIILRNKDEIIKIHKKSLKFLFPTTSKPSIRILNKDEFMAVFSLKHYRHILHNKF